MDELQKYYAKWNEPDTKDLILHLFYLYNISRTFKFVEIDTNQWLLGAEDRNGDWLSVDVGELFGVVKIFWHLTVVIDAQLYTTIYEKIQKT